ncbi:MAG: hypothetical protein HYU36_05180 [Planctomycetes bacterium]|nr:hypothetical protein [Planctomycetota bacterium]
MGHSLKRTGIVYLVTVALLFGVLAQLLEPIRWTREAEGTAAPELFAGSEPSEVVTLLLGGFRALAVDVIWVWAMNAQEERQWHEIVFLMNLIAQLQPRFEEAYVYNGWNMAYNIAHEAETLEEKWGWILEGYNFLRMGARRNPHLYRIKFWAGWVLFDKIAQNFDPDQRQFYTGRYLRENANRQPLSDAGLWFERAHRTPGYQLQAHRTMMVHAYVRLGETYFLQDDEKRFEESLTRVYQHLDEILRYSPENDYAIRLGEEWNWNRQMIARGHEALQRLASNPQQASENLRQILSEWETEVHPQHNPFGVVANRELARTAAALAGDATERLRDEKAACSYWIKAQASLQKLLRRWPENPILQRELEAAAASLQHLGCPSPAEIPDEE